MLVKVGEDAQQRRDGHLHLKTHDLDAAYQCYIEQLGFQHVSDFPRALFMSTNHYPPSYCC